VSILESAAAHYCEHLTTTTKNIHTHDTGNCFKFA